MKVLLLLSICLTSLSAFSSKSYFGNSKSPDDSITSSLNLRSLADNFRPLQLNLNNSILENVELNSFLIKTDKQAIINDSNFDYFITMIILKEYYLQLSKYHQGFDLYSMKFGSAEFIVKSFIDLTKTPEETKGLDSSKVLEYIAANEKLKNESSIIELVNSINALKK